MAGVKGGWLRLVGAVSFQVLLGSHHTSRFGADTRMRSVSRCQVACTYRSTTGQPMATVAAQVRNGVPGQGSLISSMPATAGSWPTRSVSAPIESAR